MLKLDPEAVRKRKEKARGQARVRSFREESGNAGITGREMPIVEVLASMKQVEDRSRAQPQAGVPGTWVPVMVPVSGIGARGNGRGTEGLGPAASK